MTDVKQALDQAQAVKQKHERILLNKKNVVAVGVGFKNQTEQVAIVVNVQQKVAQEVLDPNDLLPTQLDGIPIDVIEVGQFVI